MKKIITLFFTFCLLSSCNKRVVQLPETTNKDITEVVDVSPVYMFYDEENDSIEFNRRNMISATNWLVNIDKRLTLKQILPHLQYLQEKRQGDEKHSFHNYFTCNNIELKNLSFIEFTDIDFQINHTNKLEPEFSSENYLGEVKFNSLGQIEIKSEFENHIEIEEYDFNSFFKLIDTLVESGKLTIKLSFNSKLSFQDYISIKSKLLSVKSNGLEVLNQEIIYN
ncbi:hypothetical protein [Pontimicrobium sp. SW4]|uniref:Lipoprotein n=1 Tax=Pontimicrobium sp. SW4 TaxID=3153519 RepID=A0AAU7BQF0_9FLAO